MVTSINLGNFGSVGGRNVLSGTSSGIDTKGLVESLSTAKRLPAVKLEETISANKDKIAALTSMKDLLAKFKTSLDSLRNPTFGSSATNAFSARSPFLSMTGGKTVSDYVGITTGNNAPIGKFDIKINTLAKAETRQSVAFASRTTSIVEAAGENNSGKFSAGTFQINGNNVTFNEGATLNDVAAAINSVSNQSGVTASVVKFSETDFRLVLASKTTGAANGITITDPSGVLPTAPAGAILSVTQPPLDAQIQFNGETITRSSNKITDLVDNVTFSLYQETGAEKITLDIDKDNSAIAQSIGGFVDSYNELRVFSSEQSQRDADGVLLKTSVLNNDPTMQTMLNKMALFVTGQVSVSIPNLYSNGFSTAPVRLGDLGISLTDFAGSTDAENPIPATNNILQLDPAKLNSQLESYFDSTKSVFEFGFNASSADIGIYKRGNDVTESKFKVDIDTTRPVGQQAKLVSIDGSNLVSNVNLEYQTTTKGTSLGFATTNTSVVNAAGTDTPGQFAAGTFQVNGFNVTVNEGDSLQDIANAINTATGSTTVKASIVKTGTSEYKMVINGTAEGTTGLTFTDPDGVLPTTGMFTNENTNVNISGADNGELKDFSFNYKGSGQAVVERSANISAKNITLDIDTGRPEATRAQVTKIYGVELSTPINMKYIPGGLSSTIEGVDGSQFSGLSFVYTGDGTDQINMSMQQGIADKMFNSLSEMLDGIGNAEGLIETAISNLQKTNDTLQASVDKIDEQIVSYREKMLDRFSALEAAIASANSLLQLLGAQADARNN